MHHYIRENRKALLGIFGVLLMIAFVSNIGSKPGMGGGGGRTSKDPALEITVNGSKVTVTSLDVAYANRDLEIFKQLRARNLGVMETALAEVLANHSAPGQDTRSVLFAVITRMNAETYASLLAEARQMKVRVSQETVKVLLSKCAAAPTDDSDARADAITNWLTIVQAFREATSGVTMSREFGEHALAAADQTVAVSYVPFRSDAFTDKIAPTTRQVADHFAKYANVDPDTDPMALGYRYPDQLQVEYIVVSAKDLRETIGEEEQRTFYYKNLQLFRAPASRPATTPATLAAAPTPPSTAPTTRPFLEVRQDIISALAQAKGRALLNGCYSALKGDWESYSLAMRENAGVPPASAPHSLGVPFTMPKLYLERVVEKAMSADKAPKKVFPGTFLTPLLSRKEMLATEPFKTARPNAAALSEVSAADFLFGLCDPLLSAARRRTLQADNQKTIRVFEASPMFIDSATGNLYMFRIVRALPAHAAASLDEPNMTVRVTADLRKLEGYRKAREAATAFLANARKLGLAAATNTTSYNLQHSGNFSFREPGDLAKSLTNPVSRGEFIRQSLGLLDQRLNTATTHPAGLIELPAEAAVYVAELESAQPVERGTMFVLQSLYQTRDMQGNRVMAAMLQWFIPDSVEARLATVDVRQRNSGPKPAAQDPSLPSSPPPPF